MARLTIGQKAERVLKLLIGLRNPRVAEALRQFGFQHSDLDEGWQRLRDLTAGKLSMRAPGKQDPALLAQLDTWENRWFPVASATLRARFPTVHEWLFLNLTQTEGAAVIVSVGTFVERVNKLASEPSLGAQGAEARELLSARGLNAATVQVATDMLTKLGTVAPAEPVAPIDPEVQAQAEAAMWKWYLEWGEIARVAITDRRLLRELGYLNAKRPISEEGEPSEPGGDEAGAEVE